MSEFATTRKNETHSLSKPPPASVRRLLNSGEGRPLDSETRSAMEMRLGHDFGRVRVYDDARAAESARDVNALAYTAGRNIVFGAGRYSPETIEGRQLIAHELGHVMQQGASAAGLMLAKGPDDYVQPSPDTMGVVTQMENELAEARVAAPPSKSPSEEAVRTFAIVKVVDQNGAVKMSATGSYMGKGPHAEPDALGKLDLEKITETDTTLLMVDQLPCDDKCTPAINSIRGKINGEFRVFTKTKVDPNTRVGSSPKTAALSPTKTGQELMELTEFQKLGPPSTGGSPSPPGGATPPAQEPSPKAAPQEPAAVPPTANGTEVPANASSAVAGPSAGPPVHGAPETPPPSGESPKVPVPATPEGVPSGPKPSPGGGAMGIAKGVGTALAIAVLVNILANRIAKQQLEQLERDAATAKRSFLGTAKRIKSQQPEQTVYLRIIVRHGEFQQQAGYLGWAPVTELGIESVEVVTEKIDPPEVKTEYHDIMHGYLVEGVLRPGTVTHISYTEPYEL